MSHTSTATIESTARSAPAPLSPGQRLAKNLFGTITDTVITLLCALILAWLAYQVIDWAFLSSVWRAEDEPLCRDASGACWSIIDARHRIILFGLFPYEEHWRSALACLVIIVTVIASCFSWFWTARRLAPLWIIGFGSVSYTHLTLPTKA